MKSEHELLAAQWQAIIAQTCAVKLSDIPKNALPTSKQFADALAKALSIQETLSMHYCSKSAQGQNALYSTVDMRRTWREDKIVMHGFDRHSQVISADQGIIIQALVEQCQTILARLVSALGHESLGALQIYADKYAHRLDTFFDNTDAIANPSQLQLSDIPGMSILRYGTAFSVLRDATQQMKVSLDSLKQELTEALRSGNTGVELSQSTNLVPLLYLIAIYKKYMSYLQHDHALLDHSQLPYINQKVQSLVAGYAQPMFTDNVLIAYAERVILDLQGQLLKECKAIGLATDKADTETGEIVDPYIHLSKNILPRFGVLIRNVFHFGQLFPERQSMQHLLDEIVDSIHANGAIEKVKIDKPVRADEALCWPTPERTQHDKHYASTKVGDQFSSIKKVLMQLDLSIGQFIQDQREGASSSPTTTEAVMEISAPTLIYSSMLYLYLPSTHTELIKQRDLASTFPEVAEDWEHAIKSCNNVYLELCHTHAKDPGNASEFLKVFSNSAFMGVLFTLQMHCYHHRVALGKENYKILNNTINCCILQLQSMVKNLNEQEDALILAKKTDNSLTNPDYDLIHIYDPKESLNKAQNMKIYDGEYGPLPHFSNRGSMQMSVCDDDDDNSDETKNTTGATTSAPTHTAIITTPRNDLKKPRRQKFRLFSKKEPTLKLSPTACLEAIVKQNTPQAAQRDSLNLFAIDAEHCCYTIKIDAGMRKTFLGSYSPQFNDQLAQLLQERQFSDTNGALAQHAGSSAHRMYFFRELLRQQFEARLHAKDVSHNHVLVGANAKEISITLPKSAIPQLLVGLSPEQSNKQATGPIAH